MVPRKGVWNGVGIIFRRIARALGRTLGGGCANDSGRWGFSRLELRIGIEPPIMVATPPFHPHPPLEGREISWKDPPDCVKVIDPFQLTSRQQFRIRHFFLDGAVRSVKFMEP